MPPTAGIPFPHSPTVGFPPAPPRNILSTGCIASCQAAAQGPQSALPSPGSPALQVLPVPTVTHDAVTSVRVLWENRWLPQIREIPGGLFTKGDRRGGRGKPQRKRRTSGPTQVGHSPPPGLEEGGRRGRQQVKQRVTRRRPDPESNDIQSRDTACRRSPQREEPDGFSDLPPGPPLGESTGLEGQEAVCAVHGDGAHGDSDPVLTLNPAHGTHFALCDELRIHFAISS